MKFIMQRDETGLIKMSDELEFHITCKYCGAKMHFADYEEHVETEHHH